MVKIDGHTHTELCPHGSHESTRKMVERAIQLGFDEYWMTEHAPMPAGFASVFGGPLDDYESEGLADSQVDDYLKLATDLQAEYQHDIQIKIGFEIDYLHDFTDSITNFLAEYGPYTQHNILSVHYLQDDDGTYWGIDYDPDELKTGFGQELHAPQRLYSRYFKTVLESAQTDLGRWQPDKMGHISLIKKYQDYFKFPELFDQTNLALIQKILRVMAKRHLSLDVNSAGLYKKFCNDFYPGTQIFTMAKQIDIPMVFGSDAHAIDEVGRGYHLNELFKRVDN
ncbi:histidinol-phosphatase HisJ [Nicoliella lavandulae]|uniref:Histidinol-phosphatase n=1 Tax=Nicoliella lavandulae TaxID=3082954 RepID=A0ABU8SNQ9_9LACO